jgi:2'-5' RNA ligase
MEYGFVKSIYEEEKENKYFEGRFMSRTIRSFIAFDLESDPIIGKIEDLQSIFLRTGAHLKLVEPENIHVTIRFLGNITTNMVEKIFEEMEKIQFIPFEVKIKGAGAFPNLRYPRVLWAGITEGVIQLRSIFDQLEPRLRKLGFKPDFKGFSPHITIARVKSGRNKNELIKRVKENRELEFGTFRTECLKLKRSDLTPRGPSYLTLKEFCPKNK